MTVDWAGIQTALTAFVAQTGIVPASHVFAEREAHPQPNGSFVELTFTQERAIGDDDIAWVEQTDALGDYEVPRITGIREFVCQFKMRSRSQAQAAAARTGLETLRASFHHPVRTQPLTEMGLGFLSSNQLITLDYYADNRWESIAILEVRFSVVSTLYDTSREAAGVPVDEAHVSINGSPPMVITAE